MLFCANCDREAVDEATGQCTSCGMYQTTETEFDATAIDEALPKFFQNVQIRLFEMQPHEFQQVAGLLSPRAGYDDSDGVEFTEDSCRQTHRYLVAQGILCARIAYTANRRTMFSLIFGQTRQGVERGLRVAYKAARQHRAVVKVDFPE